MLNLEKNILKHIEKYIDFYFIFIISIIGFLIRWLGRGFISSDMSTYLLPWFNEALELGGIKSIAYPIGDYNIPYQFFIGIITNFSIYPVTLYKLLSIVFDYVLAISTGLLAAKLSGRNIFSIVYATIMILPTIFFNSGYWGQADSIYSSFIIISLVLLKNNKFMLSFIFLGIAMSFKLQTIFIIPLYAYYYILKKKYSIIKMGIVSSISFYLMCLPGFIFGRGLFEPITIYLQQANYAYLWANYPSFWSIITTNHYVDIYYLLKKPSILLCFAILLIGLFYMMKNKVDIDDNKIFVYTSVWVVYTCIMFLVNMHDRYAYLLDVLFLISIFVNKNLLKYWIIPLVISLVVYGNYLFLYNGYGASVNIVFNFLGIANLINYVALSAYIIKKTQDKEDVGEYIIK